MLAHKLVGGNPFGTPNKTHDLKVIERIVLRFCQQANVKVIEKLANIGMEPAESLEGDELRDAVRLYNRCSPS